MAEPHNPLLAFSDHAAELVDRTASSIVSIHGGGRWSSSGIHWRSGFIVTAEEVLERDEGIKITLPGGREVEATLAGRDPWASSTIHRASRNCSTRTKLMSSSWTSPQAHNCT